MNAKNVSKNKTEFLLVAGKRMTTRHGVLPADPTLDAVSTFFAIEVILPELNTCYELPTCFS